MTYTHMHSTRVECLALLLQAPALFQSSPLLPTSSTTTKWNR